MNKKEIKFNSSAELAEHLMTVGDVYGVLGGRLYFDRGAKGSPFIFEPFETNEAQPIQSLWETNINNYYIKQRWEDCIPEGKGVPCYVSDVSRRLDDLCAIKIIVDYTAEIDRPYLALAGSRWRHATPIPASELWIPEDE